MNVKFIITLTVVSCLSPIVIATFPHALGGFVTDVAANPLKFLAILLIKKLILLKLGLLLLGKRSIDSPHVLFLPESEATAADFEKLATKFDENGCIAKLICEIMAGDESNGKFEKAVGKYFKSVTAEELSQSSPSAAGHSVFHYAAFMGKLTRRTDSCGLIFQKCTTNMIAMKKTANAAFEFDI